MLLGQKQMRHKMATTLAAAAMLTAPAYGTFVTEIGSVGMDASFGPGGLGSTLSISEDNNYADAHVVDFTDGTLITVKFSDGSSDGFGAAGLPDNGLGDFILTDLSLLSITFEDGMAVGTFGGGSVVLRDEIDSVLFTADIDELVLKETDVSGDTWLVGAGTYSNGVTTVPGADGLPSEGGVVNVIFDLSIDFDDFACPFEATADMNFIPEPAPLALLAVAGIALMRRR
jgi:hypothetical protein